MIDDATLARARVMADEMFERNLAESRSFLASVGATPEEIAAEVEIYRRQYAADWVRNLAMLRAKHSDCCGAVH